MYLDCANVLMLPQEPLQVGKRVWILQPNTDRRVVALGRTGGHYKTSKGTNKNGMLRRVCVFPQQLVDVLQLVLHEEAAMYAEEDGSMKIVDEAMTPSLRRTEN